MNNKKVSLILSLCCCLMTFPFAKGVKDNNGTTAENQISVVTTIFPCYDIVRSITTGEIDEVSGLFTGVTPNNIRLLVKPGTEVHSFDPSPQDILAIRNADIFVYIGGDSDEWVEQILESMDSSRVVLVRLMDYVQLYEEEHFEDDELEAEHDHNHDHAHDHENTHSHPDEHIWTSPKNEKLLVEAVAKALISVDENKYNGNLSGAYRTNADTYIGLITEIENNFSTVIKSKTNLFMIMGDRFPIRYFAEQYDMDYTAAFSGCSTAVEASTATIARLIDTAKEKNIPSIFTIELSNQKIAKVIAEATNTQVLEFHTVHNVTKNDFDKGVTWVSLMKKNVTQIEKGLK